MLLSTPQVQTQDFENLMEDFGHALSLMSFPTSFRVTRGPLAAPPLLLMPPPPTARFPDNINFIQVRVAFGGRASRSCGWSFSHMFFLSCFNHEGQLRV